MTIEENILKEKLVKIISEDYLLGNKENYYPLGLEMLENIGSTEAELRDDLIYDIFSHWILDNRFTFEQLRTLLNISTSQLFYKLGEGNQDAVFKRTFSALVIALIIYKHRQENFLSEKELYELKDKLIEYMLKEKDLRGYVEVKGWAHSAAHTADALDELGLCNCFNNQDLLDILKAIKAKVCIGYYAYIDEESERMVTPVESIFNRKILSNEEIIHWLQSFNFEKSKDNYIEYLHLKVNIKGFLRSLYFRLLEQEASNFIIEELKQVLKKL